MNNLWEIIAKERGVSLDEEFIYGINGVKDNKCKITREKGLETYNERLNSWVDDCRYIDQFIKGEGEIAKIPFEPKMGENYWTYCAGITLPIIECYSWGNSCYDRERKLFGIVFRTEQEAIDYLPTWEKRLQGEEL